MTNQSYQTSGNKDIVVVKSLKKFFPVRAGVFQRVVANVQAVDNVSFTIKEGECLGLVGKSGCGKTTVGRTMLRLTEPTAGSVMYEGVDVFKLKGRDLKAMRRNMQIIFQDPYASLDPRMPIGELVMEGLKIHGIGTPRERFEVAIETLKKVGPGRLPRSPLPARIFRRTAPADWHRARPGPAPQIHHLRRARLGAGCIHPVPGAEHPQRPASRIWPDLLVHCPQLERG